MELYALLKVVPRHIQSSRQMLIDIHKYKPTWVVGATSAMPKELDFTSSTAMENGRMRQISQ